MFDSLISMLSASPWTYLIVFASIMGSAVVPLLPSESMIVTAGVLAGTGALDLPYVLLAGALGAFAGDNLGYLVGRGLGVAAFRWVERGERRQRSLEWARGLLDRGGGPLIVADRFIPGGRTAVSITAGTLSYPWRRYVVFSAIGSVAWAVYGSLLGYLVGEAFQQSLWKKLLLALGIVAVVGAAVELVRRRRSRQGRQFKDRGPPP